MGHEDLVVEDKVLERTSLDGPENRTPRCVDGCHDALGSGLEGKSGNITISHANAATQADFLLNPGEFKARPMGVVGRNEGDGFYRAGSDAFSASVAQFPVNHRQ